MTTLGLRIDVDTLRGTREGVPRLIDLLAKYDVKATFFFTVGPDNMGRHLWRVLNPEFAYKMIRSGAAGLYGWEILLAGTCWPGRSIARNAGNVIQGTDRAGHEVGLHAWDHHRWQARADRMTVEELRAEIAFGVDTLGNVLGKAPRCSAAPGWKCNERVLEAKEAFGFLYNSDCRGHGLFVPVVDGRLCALQVPTTLPTYDEIIGSGGTTLENYNERLLGLIRPNDFNVLTIHAEVEGIVCADLFEAFLRACQQRSIRLVPLQSLLEEPARLPQERIAVGHVEGRAGTVGWQQSALSSA